MKESQTMESSQQQIPPEENFQEDLKESAEKIEILKERRRDLLDMEPNDFEVECEED